MHEVVLSQASEQLSGLSFSLCGTIREEEEWSIDLTYSGTDINIETGVAVAVFASSRVFLDRMQVFAAPQNIKTSKSRPSNIILVLTMRVHHGIATFTDKDTITVIMESFPPRSSRVRYFNHGSLTAT
jgi:hypothetical protein